MKLLIVDDQQSVVQGLCDGIRWKDIGITEVVTAKNAMEARLVFLSAPPRIMLCDIEMPVESGIDLGRWVRDNHFDTRIIFLSCHATFEYAQDAIRLDSYDYIVQPAPNSLVAETVARVVAELHASEENQNILAMGELYNRRKLAICSSLLSNRLNSHTDDGTLDAVSDILAPDRPVRLVLVQMLEVQPQQAWSDDLLLVALDNFAGEILGQQRYAHITALTGENTFCLVLQSADTNLADEPDLEKLLQYLHDVFKVYMPYKIACYTQEKTGLADLSKSWDALIRMRDANVARYSGVFTASSSVIQNGRISQEHSQISYWESFVKEGKLQELEDVACAALDSMVENNRIDASTLWHFYRAFLSVVFRDAAQETADDVGALYSSPEFIELYRNGMRSVDDMKRMIHYIVENYDALEDGRTSCNHEQLVAKTMAYIQRNLGENLRIETLAQQFYVSGDHLTRIFKRQTGQTIKAYITSLRMREAKNLLLSTQLPVSYIAAQLGYTNFSHFSTAYRKEMGLSPQEERDRAPGLRAPSS